MKEMRCLHCYSNEFSERNGHLYCVYCGSKYRQRPEDQEILLSMAYRELRFMNFLDAENAFEDIISRHPDLPEAYWGCVCARYGIKFEQDYTGRQIPTCCLPAIESILEDRYYQKAVELSDEETAAWYSKQGEYLERVRKTWIERARKLAPYDVFISYKDSDQEKGLDRTEDSLKAQSIYTHLLTQGYSVFYSRESLSNVIGEKYEPYIFQALSTSRAMIVYGSTPEYINSTWVRNEWQRYAKKMQKGEKDKGSLIVICDGFSPKDLPPMLRSMQMLDGRDMFCYSKLDEHLKGLLAKKANPEEEAKKKAEEEARKRAEAKAEAKKQAEAEAKKKAENKAKRKSEEAKIKEQRDALNVKENKENAVENNNSMATNTDEKSISKPKNVFIRHWKLTLSIIAAIIILFLAGMFCYKTLYAPFEGLKFTSNGDGTCSVSGIGTCKDTEIVIPEESPEGDKVTCIGAAAFNKCSTLKSVTIPVGVTKIDNEAFFGCSALTSINIPEGVTQIRFLAFSGCTALTSVTIPNSMTRIEGSAFIDCESLTTITFQGTKAEWEAIPKDFDWDKNTGSYTVH
ncbi:MAG: leucine-rich repeat protein, partial [Clostridia bacterium]|nr:leucine-rich repeat protein [Clostridia bacterium]